VASVVSPALTAVPQPASASASQPSVSTVAVTFDPISVTAISTNSYWVLGSTACAAQRCAALAHTTDGGATFTRLGRTSDGSPMPPIVTTVEDGTTVRDVRFGDTENGWMYGGALYTTHDGGATWAPDNSIPNDVVDMAAASGEVWAVALRVVGSSESYGLYHATYGASGTSAWAEVNLGGVTILDQPKLAVIDTTSFLLATQPSGQAITLVLTNGVGSHTSVPGPCKLTPAQSLSVAGDGALWAFCAAGHTGEIYVSINSGTSWTGGMISEMGPIGGVDSSHAFVAIGTGLKLVTVDNGGAHSTTISPFGQSQLTGVKFIGFTTINVGFAVVYDQNSGSELWRTTDGGQTWAVVAF
jgi:photosystem II stability/assembly factor-like uncharacterized protein